MSAGAGCDLIRAALPASGAPVTLRIAYSGGRDSHVLLHWLAAERSALAPHRLRAVHVDHGLHPHAARWADHCAQVCDGLGVALDVHRVDAGPARGQSAEAAARAARYAALVADMQAGDLLLTAHHQADQAETVLLALLRGTGLAGVAAMPARQRFGAGWLLRPLLDWPPARLAGYAHTHALRWIDDPSNAQDRFDRNFLRRQIVPLLATRWPALAESLARHAAHAGQAQALLDELAAGDGAGADTLSVAQLAALSVPRRYNLLRGWLRAQGAPAPSTARLDELLRQALTARPDGHAQLRIGTHTVRLWRGRLYLTDAVLPGVPAAPLRWRLDAPLELPGLGQLRAESAPGRGIAAALLEAPPTLEVRFRGAGSGGKTLKKRFQATAQPPWQRAQVPLLYCAGRLVQVAGDEPLPAWRAAPGACGFRIVWQPAAR